MRDRNLLFAWIISIIALLGSLYFSEIKGYIPCDLCWYQRICMYPLTLILGFAYFKIEQNISYYVLPLSIIGSFIAFYQYLLQKVFTEETSVCGPTVSCSQEYINILGFITFPLLSLISFVLIIIFLILHKKKHS